MAGVARHIKLLLTYRWSFCIEGVIRLSDPAGLTKMKSQA